MSEAKYKILVADDEYWTRELLLNIIDWEKYGLLFMEPAKDGEEVLRLMSENCPDILITDINMPFINGVELIRAVNDRYPHVVTVVLSGYDDYEYIRETMKSGSIDYLLKPISKVELVSVLTRALELLAQRRSIEEEKKSIKDELMRSASLLQDREFSVMIEKDSIPDHPGITAELNMDVAGYSLMLIKIHNMSVLSKEYRHNINQLSYRMKKRIKEIVCDRAVIVFNNTSKTNEFIIISEISQKALKDFGNKILIEFEKKSKSPITVTISGHSFSWESIHSAYIEAVSLLNIRPFCISSIVITEEDSSKAEFEKYFQSRISPEQEKSLILLMKSANKTKLLNTVLNKIGLGKCSQNNWSYLEVRQTVSRLINILGMNQNENSTAAELIELENWSDFADKIIELLDQDTLTQTIVNIVEQLTDAVIVEVPDTVADIIKQAVRYIEKNYSEELTLSGLAKRFSVESSYFSKVFHQQTGDTLISYITKQRMSKAIQCIEEDNISLTEIAFLVGYDDYTYFSRLFKKTVGQSPRDYKKVIPH